MTIQQADPRRQDPDSAAMESFTLKLPHWLSVLVGRNPLIRRSDRVEALALLLTFAVALLAAPIAGAAGTAIYDARTQFHAEQAQTRTAVTATVTKLSARSDPTRVQARWFAAGTEHTGSVHAPSRPETGDSIEILVDQDGSYAGPPHMSAAREAVFGALAVWLNVTVAALLAFFGVRRLLDRTRSAGWRPELVHLAGGGRSRGSGS